MPVEIYKAKEQRTSKPINLIVSFCPATEKGGPVSDNRRLRNWQKKYLRYKNTAKVPEWETVTREEFPTHATYILDKTILTDADVVKLKEKYPGYYQSTGQRMAAFVYDRAAGAMISRTGSP